MSRLLLDGVGPDLRTHQQVRGPRPELSGDQVLRAAEESGLTGRGGARFPLHRKLAAVRKGRRPMVVANGAEGEPGSRKDAVLLDRAPHLVLDGLLHAAVAVGADRAVLYVHAGPGAIAARRAVAERRDLRRIEVVEAPPAFLSGEESAVVSWLDGFPAVPRDRPPAVFEKGVGGRPTLVSNVETLAHLALVLRDGPDRFRREGTVDEPGTMLCTVWGRDTRTVVEVPLGTPLVEVLATGGVVADELQAVLVGGYHGAWLGAHLLPGLGLSLADLATHGASPGAGVLLTLHPDHCPLRVSARILRYLADSSARQCGPCLNGLPAMATVLEQVAGGHARPADLRRLEQLAGLVVGRGACKHPDGTVRFVRSVVAAFGADLSAHQRGGCLSTTLTGRPWRTL